MKGEIFGIPLLLIVPALFVILCVDVPMALLNRTTQEKLLYVQQQELNTRYDLKKVAGMIVVPSPTATPSASPTPSRVLFRPVAEPTPSK